MRVTNVTLPHRDDGISLKGGGVTIRWEGGASKHLSSLETDAEQKGQMRGVWQEAGLGKELDQMSQISQMSALNLPGHPCPPSIAPWVVGGYMA